MMNIYSGIHRHVVTDLRTGPDRSDETISNVLPSVEDRTKRKSEGRTERRGQASSVDWETIVEINSNSTVYN